MLQGFDVSHHNQSIDWAKAEASGQSFAFLKATEGLNLVDSTFEDNFKNALGYGFITGAYHFFHPALDSFRQASHFLSTFDNHLPILTAVDLEWTEGENEWDKISVEDGCKAVQTFIDAVTHFTTRKPFLYFSPAFAKQYLSKLDLTQYPGWVADYVQTPPDSYTIWQYSEKGTVPGLIPGIVDLDRFEGSLDELKALAGMQ
jgi:lysozyme